MRKPFGIWIVTVLSALVSLSQLQNIAEIFLFQHGAANAELTLKLVFSIVAFLLAGTWSALTFRKQERAVFFGGAFFVWSLVPFVFVLASMTMAPTPSGAIMSLLPIVLLWSAILLSLVLWTRRLISQ